MKVPLLDLKPQYQQIKDRVVPEIMQVIEEQGFILGPRVVKMEEEMARFIGTRFAVGVSSGTDALILALMALKIGCGDEVITSPYTFFATGGSIARAGAKPVFVDIEPDTYNIDTTKIEAAITDKTKAILPVHLFGQCADMDAICSIASKHGLKVIEDAAQAVGSTFKGKGAGSIGDIGCFSFFPSKNLGGFGDGGLVSTNDEELFERLKMMRVHGGQQQYHHNEIGMNGRLDALQAVVISVKLPHLPRWTEGRRRNADFYDQAFASNPNIKTPRRVADRYHIFNQYVLRVKDREGLKKQLSSNDIGCSVYYPISLHQQKCFSSLGYKTGDMPVSEAAANETIALPIYPELPRESLEFVAKTVNAFYS